MTIKNLVISGGGSTFIQTLGAIQHLEQENFLNLNSIEKIYGTSAGAIVAIFIALKYDWPTLNDYIIKRPWHKTFPISIKQIFEAFSKKGLLDFSFFETSFKPLFKAKDLDLNITFKQFFEYSKIELHFFTYNLTDMKTIDLSHLTHPDLPVLKGLHMSGSLPIFMAPVFYEGKCYIDGGIQANYPMNLCLNAGNKEEETMGFANEYNDDSKLDIDEESNILSFIFSFIFRIIWEVSTDLKQKKIKNEVKYPVDSLNMEKLIQAMSSSEIRIDLLQSGVDASKAFLHSLPPKEN
jgi:predicted acylesterase/phospholipase RssA